MDESGNTKEEVFFGLGILLIPVDFVGNVYDDMRVFVDKAKMVAKSKKEEKILEYIEKEDFTSLMKITTSNKDFELKFKNINYTNKNIYKGIIDQYFLYDNVKFASLVINKTEGADFFSYWDLYIHRAAMLIANTIKKEPDAEYVLISDGITQPKGIEKKFENSIFDAICSRLRKNSISENVFFGVLREESHASYLIQLVDILLGATMYFIKKKQGLISEKLAEKRDLIANTLREKVGNPDFNENFTINTPNYFSVRHFKSQ